jgi:hypothetical protein
MQRFKASAQAQRFLSAQGVIYGHFRPRRHLMTAGDYRRYSREDLQGLAAGDVRPNDALTSSTLDSSAQAPPVIR